MIVRFFWTEHLLRLLCHLPTPFAAISRAEIAISASILLPHSPKPNHKIAQRRFELIVFPCVVANTGRITCYGCCATSRKCSGTLYSCSVCGTEVCGWSQILLWLLCHLPNMLRDARCIFPDTEQWLQRHPEAGLSWPRVSRVWVLADTGPSTSCGCSATSPTCSGMPSFLRPRKTRCA